MAVPLGQAPKCGAPIPVATFKSGVLSVSCSTTIAAPPLKCIEALLNAPEYPSWNTFCPRVIIEKKPPLSDVKIDAPSELRPIIERDDYLYPGVQFQFEVVMTLGKPSRPTYLVVSELESIERDGRPGYRIAWVYRGQPSWLLRSERIQEFVLSADGKSSDYYCWETFGGIASHAIGYFVGSQLEDGFGRWMNNLKDHVEAPHP